jgi:16S rRNA (uracil1498-N3)-methyltransferase
MTRRRWIADTWDETTAALTGEQATHLIRVLRAQQGMEFDVVAGTRVYRAVISGIGATGVQMTLLNEIDAAAALPLTLLLAVIKFDRFEWALEKITELGAAEVVPVLARRTEKHLAQAAQARVERWRRIAREAAQQSRRSDVPMIQDPQSLKAALAQTTAPGTLSLLLSETEHQHALRAALEQDSAAENVRVAIGPEGGWTAEEFSAFQQAGWTAVTLGPRILRAETAAMAAAAVCGAWMAATEIS